MELKNLDLRFWDKKAKCYREPVIDWRDTNTGLVEMFISIDTRKVGHTEDLDESNYEVDLCVGVDRKGKKVYEGDIVKFYRGSSYKPEVLLIIANDGTKNYPKAIKETEQGFIEGLSESVIYESCEVIGNIHENPELLKDKE